MTKEKELEALARGEGCLGRSQADEPVFVLVGRDMFAADLVREWSDKVERTAVNNGEYDGARQAKVREARALALQMDRWRGVHGGKLPG